MQSGVSDFAQRFGWASIESQPNFAGARGSQKASTLPTLVRKVTIAGQQYELRIQPTSKIEDKVLRFELQNATQGEMIPSRFKLRLLTEDLQPFDGN